jgi:hypothetical protein
LAREKLSSKLIRTRHLFHSQKVFFLHAPCHLHIFPTLGVFIYFAAPLFGAVAAALAKSC